MTKIRKFNFFICSKINSYKHYINLLINSQTFYFFYRRDVKSVFTSTTPILKLDINEFR